MTISKNFNTEEVEQSILKQVHKTPFNSTEFSSSYDSTQLIPRFEIPEESSESSLVAKYLREELSLDGNPTLNLASFVNTEIAPTASELVKDNIVKNLADNDEYPSLIEFQTRCINILSNLWHAPTKFNRQMNREVPTSVGTPTTGSSEAVMLAGLAMKKAWQAKRKQQGKSIENPNILMATCAQVALEKFASYFDVENRLIEITHDSGYLIDVSKIKENIDENTIGIFVILGSTFTGAFEPVLEISKLLDEVEKESGIDVKIHVDGASGAFVAPFIFPDLKWDFQIDRVVSINTSGHKFGLTTAGLGWVIWRDMKYLPESLRFKLDYLGGVEETFSLNFSRPGFPVIHQYYNLLTFGRDGYTEIFSNSINNARNLSFFLDQSEYFEVLSVIHKPAKEGTYTSNDVSGTRYNQKFAPGLPVVAFRFSEEFRKEYPQIPQSILSLLLRNKGYIIPNYHLPPAEQGIEVLRIVVRQSLSLNLLEKLMQDIITSVKLLVSACESVGDFSKIKQSEALDQGVVYDLLLSIASGGVEELKQIQKKMDSEVKEDHKKGYRGTC